MQVWTKMILWTFARLLVILLPQHNGPAETMPWQAQNQHRPADARWRHSRR